MDDVVIICQDAFLATRPVQIDRIVSAKIDAIFALDCFNEQKVKQMAFKPRSTNSSSSGHRFAHIGKDLKPPRARIGVQSYQEKLMREVTSNLNKLNGANVDTIAGRLARLFDAHNAQCIISHVLEKSCTNGSYIEHFFTLMQKIGHEEAVEQCIKAFVNLHMVNMESVFCNLESLEYNDYDQFCDFIKQKNVVINKNKLVLHYIKNGVVDTCMDDYFDRVFGLIQPGVPGHIQDLLLQLVADLTLVGPESCYNKLMRANEALFAFISSKSKFLIQDTLNQCESRHGNLFVCKARGRRFAPR